jgi:cell wall-associated NlpC family hydrolase
VRLENGKQGWVARQFLSLPKIHAWKALGKGWINANSVNIRSGPSTQDSVKAKANKGTPVRVLKKTGDWFYVRLNSSTEGWVAGWLLNFERKGVAGAPNKTKAVAKGDPKGTLPAKGITATAMKYLGCPYRFGGSSSAGFDCSGFVYYIMAQLGKRLPRRGRDMMSVGSPVARENLRSGDVIFFENTYRRGISHVGIYIGGDKFIHASSAGGSVIITPLSKSYYSNRFCGARRI